MRDDDTPGDVVITWDAVETANHYRIGGVAYPDCQEITEAGRPWDEAFASHAYPVCHRQGRSDAAISLNWATIPPAARLPRFTRNDRLRKVGTHEAHRYWNSEDDYAGFNAVLEGNDHTISNLYIIRSDADVLGLFALTLSDSVIRRVGLASSYVAGDRNVGSLVVSNCGEINDYSTTSTASGTGDRIGGLVGLNGRTVTASYATASVTDVAAGHPAPGRPADYGADAVAGSSRVFWGEWRRGRSCGSMSGGR